MSTLPPAPPPLFIEGECDHSHITIDHEVVIGEWREGRTYACHEEYRFTCTTCGATSTTKTINITGH